MAGADTSSELNKLSEQIIAAAFEVSNQLGAGFLEKAYERALIYELELRGIKAEAQRPLAIEYKGRMVGDYFADVFVENSIVVELKCCNEFADEHMAQCLNYLKASGLKLALLINFRRPKVEIKRVVRNF
jgi:GxxExxY protein